MFRRGSSIGLACACLLAAAGCHNEPIDFFCTDLRTEVHQPFQCARKLDARPPVSSYYRVSRGSWIDTATHSWVPPGGTTPQTVLLLSSDDTQRRLQDTDRFEAVLSTPFGNVNLDKKCRYPGWRSGYVSSLEVDSYVGRSEMAPPRRLQKPTGKLPPLSGVVLVRILPEGSNFTMFSGTYEADGRPKRSMTSTFRSDGGLVGSNVRLRASPVRTAPEEMALLGFPAVFDAAAYTRAGHYGWPATTSEDVEDAVILRYGFDALLRVDVKRPGLPQEPVFLEPVVLPEDSELNEACDAMLREQLREGLGVN